MPSSCVKDRATIGIGAGQMSRVVSSKIAAMKAKDEGLIAARRLRSPPMPSSRSATASTRSPSSASNPSSSRAARKRDAEVIAAADEHGIAMVFTGMRHFRH